MARIKAGFVGIDRYEDPEISDLCGAAQDATALWALFYDSVTGLEATLLVDDEATHDQVEKLFVSLLDEADPDDVVILGFAGHGTRDLRLVPSDARLDTLETTTIPMASLASRFARSKARAIIGFLDCCFSGGAPARVVEASLAIRDVASLAGLFAGRGRVLIAASAQDQPALEDPVTRHGLFTRALLQVLEAEESPRSILALIDEVSRIVRAEAARLGYEQTPTHYGHIEGELLLPALRRGEAFLSRFPDRSGIRVSTDFADLAAFGISDEVIKAWQDRYPAGLNALQLAAVNDHRVLEGKHLLVVAPTSSGKTFIGELAGMKAAQNGQKVIFLLPYKALVNEKFEDFSALYGGPVGLRIARCSGDWQDQTGRILRGKYDIAFFTYEKFLGLSLAFPHILNQLGVIVLDEAQFITNPTRGITVELLLTNLLSARGRGIEPQLIALSAVISDRNHFDRWLGCDALVTSVRPVPLVEGVLDRSGTYRFRREDGQTGVVQLLEPWEIRRRRQELSSQDLIVPLVRKLVAVGETVLVFRNQRGSAQGCATYLAAELGLPSAADAVAALPQFDQSSTSQALRTCLEGGVAFHSSNLNREERSIVEASFRAQGSEIKVLVATSTVAAGINTPASTAIIVETEFPGERNNRVPYTVAEYKNMAGRAGRLGRSEEGRAILLAETPIEAERLFRRYVCGTPEPLVSSFDAERPATWIIRLLAQARAVTREQVMELVANTYGGFLASLQHPDWRRQVQASVEALLDRMLADGLVEVEGEQLKLTMLGRACGEAPLTLESCMRLIEMLRRLPAEALRPEALMIVAQALPEADADYTAVSRHGRAETGMPSQIGTTAGYEVVNVLRHRAESDVQFYARCKRSLILLDWISGVPVDRLETNYSLSAFSRIAHGDIRGYVDSTRFHLDSIFRIASIVRDDFQANDQEEEAFLKRLDLGLPQEALALTELPPTLTRGEYLALYEGGLRTPDELRSADVRALARLVGAARAAEIKQAVEAVD